MKFSTAYNRDQRIPEVLSQKTRVDNVGYVPAKKRIEDMILAGQRLVDYRRSQFDFDYDKIDEDFNDPTRNPNFDLADATQLNMSIKPIQTVQEPQNEPLKVPEGYKLVKDEISPEGA